MTEPRFEVETHYEVARDSVLYVVDGSSSMYESGALSVTLNAVCVAIRKIAVNGARHNDVGVIVYNITQGNSKSCAHVMLSLSEPTVESLKELIRLSKTDDYFQLKYMTRRGAEHGKEEGPTGIIAALRLARSELNKLHTRSYRRVILITDDDNPVGGNNIHTNIVANIMGDITGSPAYCMPLFINREKAVFDVKKFWINLNFLPPPIASLDAHIYNDEFSSSKFPDPIDLSALKDSAKNLVISKSKRKYVAIRGKIVLGSLKIGFRGYNIVRRTPRRTCFRIARIKKYGGQVFKDLLKYENADLYEHTAVPYKEDADDQGLKKFFSLSSTRAEEDDKSVLVSDEDLNYIHDISSMLEEPQGEHSVIKVHGFYPMKNFEIQKTVGHSVFITPSNDFISKSWKSFACLHRSMNRKNVYGLVTLMPPDGKNTIPQRGFLFASDPHSYNCIKDEQESTQQIPAPNTTAGMFFVPLPFADDERTCPQIRTTEHLEDSSKLYDTVVNLIRKFQLPSGFNPDRYPNPVNNQFEKILDHHALSLSLGDESLDLVDSLKPSYDKINVACSRLLKDLMRLINCETVQHSSVKRRKEEGADVIKMDDGTVNSD